MKKPDKQPLRQWRVTLIRAQGHVLGRVEARIAEEAIKIAAETFGIDKAHTGRLVAQEIKP